VSVNGSRSVKKRNRQGEKRRIRNKTVSTRIKTTAKKVLKPVEEKNKDKAVSEYKNFSSYVDSAARKGILHKNTAARKKSRMQKKLNSLS